MYICMDCGLKFEENEANIIEFGTGAKLSKEEYFSCPDCESMNIKDEETGKIQRHVN